ncbi:MAG: hypothetical protein IJX98_04715 [Clostridia bacterium]|nr:hypothetical protein [Clostridia bacterium]
MQKKTFYTELAYLFGLIILSLGAALMTIADLGLSMVVAPAYLLHLKISKFLPFFSFGMAEYAFQASLLLITVLVLRKFRVSFLFSFLTAVLYGLLLDLFIFLVGFIPHSHLAVQILLYAVGLIVTTAGVSLLFHTYISPEVYELFVKEVSAKFNLPMYKFKLVYDLVSCLVAILMSFAFFGFWQFEGVKIGTIVCAVLNGPLIGLFSKIFEKFFDFKDGLPLRPFFEGKQEQTDET